MVKIQVCVLYDYILDTEIEENKNRERERESWSRRVSEPVISVTEIASYSQLSQGLCGR